ncbi:S-adenosylmethionine/S-adenosylhomocysteine transporter [Chlamydia sp.]|uniref:S-adenosylmethionine/S-adenosylhomocysteine transporter n=1 Tax=Chlamydia sp. TaxID=35827 RepID=UPI0025C28FC2|nr:S-adenosylmethionine/S-adenosylhomocysteine transporter [Chlamydia sp.]MBQ8498925.1 S-adenosylmethionine/S-adenosylhomocysteine transporter [Chlamydia sp.]
MAIFLIFFNAFIWSSSFALSKFAMEAAAPLFVTGSRMLLAGIVLFGILLVKRENLRLPRQAIMPIMLLSVVGFYLTNVLEFIGLQGLSSSKACFIYGFSPFTAAFCSYIQLREIVTWKKLGGLSLGLVSYLVYLFFGGGEADLSKWGWQLGLPELLLIAATCLSSYGWTLLRKLGRGCESLPITMINAYAMVVAGVLSLTHSRITEVWDPFPVEKPLLFVQAIGALVIFSNLICYNLFARLLRSFSSTFLSFCNLVMPLFASFFGWLLLGEHFPPGLLLAVGFMILGCRLIYHEEFRQGYVLTSERS